ncbi:Methylmalonyl-CoA carboxyltransferase 12S subunit [archaeon HR01]|nr:Methylmalonyl-CoA carboxyltransferase 12S subunit [archaeon HR01]
MDDGMEMAFKRISRLVDDGSFREILSGVEQHGEGLPRGAGDGVVAGIGKVEGRDVVIYSHDPSFAGGSLGEVGARKIAAAYEMGVRMGVPVIAISDSSGARIHEGPRSLVAVGEMFKAVKKAKGRVPLLTAIISGCVGGAAFAAALGDIVVGVKGRGYMFLNGPKAVSSYSGKEYTAMDIGSVEILARSTGLIHQLADDEDAAAQTLKRILSYLPSNSLKIPPAIRGTQHDYGGWDGATWKELMDAGTLLELSPDYAPNLFTGLARVDGIPVAVIANNTQHHDGYIDVNACIKLSRFVRFADTFNLPILAFVDTPGFMPGPEQEHGGIVREGAEAFEALLTARVPKISIITGRAYAGGYILMCSRGIGADYVMALPNAEVAVMPAKLSAELLHRKALDLLKGAEREEALKSYGEEMKTRTSGRALLSNGVADILVEPKNMKRYLHDIVRRFYERYAANLISSRYLNP